jgi:uncharacterized protein YciI
VHFVIHAVDRPDALDVRAKHYRAHRIHLDRAGDYGVSVMTAGTLVAEDGEKPVGSLFVLEAPNRASIDAFTDSDPYRVNGVWEKVDVHYYNRKRRRELVSRFSPDIPDAPKVAGCVAPSLASRPWASDSCPLSATPKSAE